MRRVADTVTRLGAPAIPGFFRDLAWWAVRRPLVVAGILAGIPWRRWSCLEVAGENVWAMLVGLWGLCKKPCQTSGAPQKKKMYLRRRYWLYYVLTLLEGSRRQIFIVFAVYLLVKKFDYSVQAITVLFVINNCINYFFNPMADKVRHRDL